MIPKGAALFICPVDVVNGFIEIVGKLEQVEIFRAYGLVLFEHGGLYPLYQGCPKLGADQDDRGWF